MEMLVKKDEGAMDEGNEVNAEVEGKAVDMEADVTASHTIDDETVDENGKRKAHRSGDGKERKKRLKTASSLSDLNKNPCMLLNEKCRDVTYDVLSQVGPIHMPIFTVQATVGDQTFVGCGPSKKSAKLAAAEIAVQTLNLYSLAAKTENVDQSTENEMTINKETVSQQTGATVNSSELETTLTKDNTVSVVHGKHPVLILNELRPRAEFTSEEDEKTETGERKCSVKVDGQTFEAFGQSKKMAKAKAAEMALKELFGLNFSYLKDGQPIYQGDDSLWTKYKIKEAQPLQETYDGKNPIQMLNELYRELNYEYVDVSNDVSVGTKFCVVVEIEGQTFRGEGTTKKMAKTNCAVTAVKALMESGVIANRLAEKDAKKKKMTHLYPGTMDAALLDSAVIKLAVHFPDLQYRLVSWNSGLMSYTVTVTVHGENFFATGPTEQAAKNLVADKVLSKLGLWSAEDMKRKDKASTMEADSTNPSFGRGRGVRGYRGRGFGNRGVFRGGTHLGPFQAQSPSYGVPSLLGDQAEGFTGGSGGAARGGRGIHRVEGGYSRGPAPSLMSSQSLGQMGSSDNGSGMGRGSLYGGSIFHSGGRGGGVGARGAVGRSRGSTNKRGQMSNSLNKAGDSFGQTTGSSGYSHGAGRTGRGVSDSAYQTNVVNTSSGKSSASWESSSSSHAKNKDSNSFGKNLSSWQSQGNEKGSSWPTSETNSGWKGQTMNSSHASWPSENKTGSWNDQKKKPLLPSKANTEKFEATSWNSNVVGKDDNKFETLFPSGWDSKPQTASDSAAYYAGAYGTSEAVSTDNYDYKSGVSSQAADYLSTPEPSGYDNSTTGTYFDNTGGATYGSADNTYFHQDVYTYSGTDGGTYEYEGTSDTYAGMYTSEGTGNTYENYGGYGGEAGSYPMGGFN